MLGNRDAWTAGKETKCGGKFEWCSRKLFFRLSANLKFGNTSEQQQDANATCVSLRMSVDMFLAQLDYSACHNNFSIVCEVFGSFQCFASKMNCVV
jgi:hypothetical protein